MITSSVKGLLALLRVGCVFEAGVFAIVFFMIFLWRLCFVGDEGKESQGQASYLERSVRRARLEEQGVAALEKELLVAVAVEDLAAEDIEELCACVLEDGEGLRVLGHGDEKRLDIEIKAGDGVSEQAVAVSCFRASSFDRKPLARLHMRDLPCTLEALEEVRDRYRKRRSQRL